MLGYLIFITIKVAKSFKYRRGWGKNYLSSEKNTKIDRQKSVLILN